MVKQNIGKLYQRIGEFVVSFQFMENRVRSIGWFIDDPERKSWPATILRKETNQQLLDKVCEMFCVESAKWAGKDIQLGPQSFKKLIERAHKIRRYRNELIHAAYVELKGGDEVYGMIKADIKKDNNKSQINIESEFLTVSSIDAKMGEMAQIVFGLNLHYIQLIHIHGTI